MTLLFLMHWSNTCFHIFATNCVIFRRKIVLSSSHWTRYNQHCTGTMFVVHAASHHHWKVKSVGQKFVQPPFSPIQRFQHCLSISAGRQCWTHAAIKRPNNLSQQFAWPTRVGTFSWPEALASGSTKVKQSTAKIVPDRMLVDFLCPLQKSWIFFYPGQISLMSSYKLWGLWGGLQTLTNT